MIAAFLAEPETSAACQGRWDWFYPADGETFPRRQDRERKARALCRRCPLLAACRDFALSSAESHGIWAGMNEEERAAERRTRAGRKTAA